MTHKLDVTKIDKEKLFKGQKGTYLDATVFIDVDQKDQYDNNGMITQSAEKGEKGNILGNCKVFWSNGLDDSGSRQGSAPPPQAATQQVRSWHEVVNAFDDDSQIPF